MGEGQAMQYSVWRRRKTNLIPRLPLRPPDDYLRDAMVASLAEGDVELDVRLQMQTDPHLMPIENNAVLWPRRAFSAHIGGNARLPRQTFNSPTQMEFAKRLSTIRALHRRTSPVGQPEPCPAADVWRARATAYDERRAALRAERGRDFRSSGYDSAGNLHGRRAIDPARESFAGCSPP
jgi:hypothetical protein